MGKKNRPYEGPRMSLSEKQGYLRTQGRERYGINEYDTKYVDDEGNDTDANRDADILQAMNNNFSLRDAQKYGRDAGIKGFDKLGNGLTNIHDAYNTHRLVSDYGSNELGMKNVSSDQDYANISHDLFNKSRDKFAEQFATKDDLTKQDAIKKTTVVDAEPRELSDRGKAAMESANYEFEPIDRGLGSPDYAYDPNAGIADDKAGAFMKDYKSDIEKGIGNVPGRGAMSLHNRF